MDVFTLAARLVLKTEEYDSSLTSSEKKLSGFGKTAAGIWTGVKRTAAVAAAATATAGVAFAKSAVNVGEEFDAMMAQVKAVGQVEGAEFEALRDEAIRLGSTTKFTAVEAAQGLYYMALAGWDSKEMLAGIPAVLDLAAASGENLGSTSDIVTDALTAFGLKAEDTQHFVDVLAQASANSNTTVGMMGQAFKFIAPVAGALGYSIDDVAVALGLLANNGIKSSQAGTSLRQILSTLIAPTDKQAEAMEKLGLYLFEEGTDKRIPLVDVLKNMRTIFQNADFDLNGKSIEDVQEEIAKIDEDFADIFAFFDENKDAKLSAFGPDSNGLLWTYDDALAAYSTAVRKATGFNEEFLANIKEIGGLRGISSLLALMKTEDKDFDDLTNKVANSEGAAAQMADTMLDNLKGDVTILNSALEGLKIVVSDSFKDDLRSFVTTLTEEVGRLNEAFQQGGVLGMFTNLADWVIHGITGALTNASVTGEMASDFGQAIGDFVGRTVAHLVTAAPAVLTGLFKAGASLAQGLVEGLLFGLTGNGEGTVNGLIRNISEDEQDAIDQANSTATEAQGIVNYMDSLVAKYGEAAKDTKEWNTALEKLKTLMPGVNELISTQGSNLSETNSALHDYIENSRLQAIEDAKKIALQDLTNAYVNAEKERGTAAIKGDIAREEAAEAARRILNILADTYEARSENERPENYNREAFIDEWMTGLADGTLSISQLKSMADLALRGDSTIQTLTDTYNEQIGLAQGYDAQVITLTESAGKLQQELDIAQAAVANLASQAASFTVPSFSVGEDDGSHAKGAWNIPYDNYRAVLHRNEMVLTASQARQYREGNGNVNFGNMIPAIVGAIREGMAGAQVNAYMNGKRMTDEVNRDMGNRLKAARFAT